MRCNARQSSYAFVLCILTAACASGADSRGGGSWEAVVDTVGDTVVVRTLAGSVWGDTAYLEQEISIGMFDGPDEYLIGNPRSIAVGLDGVIYVLDRQVPVIRAYDSDGKYLYDIGREGGGPGEYKLPGAIATLPDGRLLLRDPGNGRVTIFSSEGEYLEQLWFPGGFNTTRRLYVDTAGFVYSLVLLNYGTAPWDWEFGLVRLSAEQGIVDTVVAPVWDYEPARLTASREGSSTSNRVPFTAEESWTFSPLGYMVGGLSSDYRVDLYRVGQPALRIEREWTPVQVKAEEKEERRRRATDNMRRQYPGWQWNGPGIPDNKPPFTEVIVSAEGNIWLQMSQEGRPTMTEAEAREEERRTERAVLR